MVRAKFVCDELTRYNGGGGKVILKAVYDPDENSENGKFFEYTPSGEIDLSIVSESALNEFEAGKEYFIDFNEAPATE